MVVGCNTGMIEIIGALTGALGRTNHRRLSEQPNILRRLIETIVPAVRVSNRRRRELVRICVVKRRDRDKVELAAEGFVLAPAPGAHPARPAKMIVQKPGLLARRYPLVLGLFVRARKQAKAIGGLHDDEPRAGLGANRAVALIGALAEINLRLKPHGPEMTASGKGFQSHFLVLQRQVVAPSAMTLCQRCAPGRQR